MSDETPDLLWKLVPTDTPRILRHCPRCGVRRPHHSGDRFRINAQHKVLDVWLIYHCEVCGMTWNMEVVERVNRRTLDKDVYDAYLRNSKDLAWRVSFDFRMLRRRGYVAPEIHFEVQGEELKLAASDRSTLQIAFTFDYPIGVRVDRALCSKLPFTRKQLDGLVQRGAVRFEPAVKLRKKVSTPFTIAIDVAAARAVD